MLKTTRHPTASKAFRLENILMPLTSLPSRTGCSLRACITVKAAHPVRPKPPMKVAYKPIPTLISPSASLDASVISIILKTAVAITATPITSRAMLIPLARACPEVVKSHTSNGNDTKPSTRVVLPAVSGPAMLTLPKNGTVTVAHGRKALTRIIRAETIPEMRTVAWFITIRNPLVVQDKGTCYGHPNTPSSQQGGTKPILTKT